MKTFIQNKLAGMKKKLTTIREKPSRVCMGYALGIFLATTPFIGLKIFIALLLTYLFKLSKAAAIIGVMHVNPITAPVFYGISYFIGACVISAGDLSGQVSAFAMTDLMELKAMGPMVFLSLLTGGAILGVPLAFASYFYSYFLIRKKKDATNELITDNNREPIYTIITGASCGLGKELAIACAQEKQNLVLVALPGRNLPLLSTRLEKEFGILSHAYEFDLTDRDAIERFCTEVKENFSVNFLINNAGTGGSMPFEESTPDYLDRIILLNIRATTLLTRLMLPELKRHPRASVLNVSSMAAFSPIPFKTVYPASKAFVTSFSKGLNLELKGTSVKICTVHPGPMLTNPDVIRRIICQGSAGKAGLLQASEIARIALKAIRTGHESIVPGLFNKLSLFLIRTVPSVIRMSLLYRVIRREITMDYVSGRN